MSITSSDVLGAPDNLSPDLGPINACIHFLIDQAANDDIVPSDHVKAVGGLGTRLRVVSGTDNALDGVLEDQIGDLVARQQGPRQCAAVDGDDQDFLCFAIREAATALVMSEFYERGLA